MAADGIAAFGQFLNYGGLGILGILCFVVLGYNVWSLNGLVRDAGVTPERMNSAKPLLFAQMAWSAVGLVAVGAGAIYLDYEKTERAIIRRATLVVDPWDRTHLPLIMIKNKPADGSNRQIDILCDGDQPAYIDVDYHPYIDFVLKEAELNRRRLSSTSFSDVVSQ